MKSNYSSQGEANSSTIMTSGEAASASIKSNNAVYLLRSSNTTTTTTPPPYSDILKGFLTGQLHALVALLGGRLRELIYDPTVDKQFQSLHHLKMNNIKRGRLNFVFGATYSPASLGVFEILTKKLKSTNDGRPLSLYQEACCGLTAGAIAAFTWQPFSLASSRIPPHNFSYRTLFCTLHETVKQGGFWALWKCSGFGRGKLMVGSMGMLTSYHRSFNYLVESRGLSEGDAQLSASIISGFIASACCHPFEYLKSIKDVVKMKYNAGEKHAYTVIPLYISKILTPHSGFRFYVSFLKTFSSWAGFCMMQWYIFELVSAAEKKYMDPTTPDSQP
ncbi:hypothetical protein Salat_0377500 [Sesamum alatum]|uniref:Mitochondrial carrier protein n=1 Tax=Sesamum alatum TaxID=300844 RepID=A0AAE1Z1V2_9LAMI|nr:hypothetical protein Salat_0377500 [Sesamum alatum]